MKCIIKGILIWGGIVLFSQISFAQIKTFQFEQIDSLQQIERRIVVIFMHTDWCNYCKAMQNTTFKNERVVNYLGKYFYFINLNAEEKRDIHFNKHTFKYKPTGANIGVHELAEQLGTVEGSISYPALCFLSHNYEIIFQHNQFLSSTDLYPILTELKNSKEK